MFLNRILHLFTIYFFGSFEGGTSIIKLKYIAYLMGIRRETSTFLSLPVVSPDCASVAVEASSLLDPECRGVCMVMIGGVSMTRVEVGVSTSIMLLGRDGIGGFFRIAFMWSALYSAFVKS